MSHVLGTEVKAHSVYVGKNARAIKSGENVFKAGMSTKKGTNRINGYDKGFEFLFVSCCYNEDELETQFLKELNSNPDKFTPRPDYGKEYFECDVDDMIDVVYASVINEITP